MTECPICQHVKINAINAALDSGRSPRLVRAQYRLESQMLDAHMAHREAANIAEPSCSCEWCSLSGYTRLKRAWLEATNQERERFCFDTRTLDVPF